jgi:predicted ATPase
VAELPSGTVTFLFTDVEGSTRLLQELGDRYPEVLAEHRRVLREAFARHGGVEVDTQGDAFFVAFPKASEALAAAAEGRDALAEGPIRVRIGLHTGEPLVAEEGYIGIDVHRAARIAAAGHGGQVLVSQSTRDLAGADALRDLGEHQLKDLTASERIYQLGEGEFPPLKSLNQTNLPVQPTPLVGRERELADVVDLLRSSRLLTLTGAGGSGKTRLALQTAAELANEFADGVWFVSLAAVTDSELVVPTIASTIGAKDDLVEFLRPKRLLLLLDNLEQLLPAVANPIAELLTAQDVKVLATSRERLALAAEQEYTVPSLPLADAVALFTARARQLMPRFEPDEHVAEIASRVDGLPLALELAAARVKVLTTEQIRDRLGHSLDLLTAGTRDAPERQRTLRATIEWSYQLLNEEEQRLFARCAVFAGSFDLDAAQAVCGADVDTLQSLTDKSLLRRTDEGRFFMLETLRAYAIESLPPDEAEELREVHADHFAQLADRRWRDLVVGGDWRVSVAEEHKNLHAALEWALANGRGETGLAIGSGIWPFWMDRGFMRRGERWLEEALALSSERSLRRADSLAGLGDIRLFQGELRGAKEAMESAVDLYRELNSPFGIAAELTQLADIALLEGDRARARQLAEEAVLVRRERIAGFGMGRTLITVGELALADGDVDGAADAYEDALAELRRDSPDSTHIPFALIGTGEIARRRGDLQTARRRFAEALEFSVRIGDASGILETLDVFAALYADGGHASDAARLAGAVERQREETGLARLSWARPQPERIEPAWSEGRELTVAEAIAYALRDID